MKHSRQNGIVYGIAWIAQQHKLSYSVATLLAGLSIQDGKLPLELIPKVAANAKLTTEQLTCTLQDITSSKLPAMLITKTGTAIIICGKHGDEFEVRHTDNIEQTQTLQLDQLDAMSSDTLYYFEKQPENDDIITNSTKHWFWQTFKKAVPIYSEVVLASLLINVFALASPLFIMNVYDRVVPNQAFDTLWVLAIGVLMVFLLDFVVKLLRGHYIDSAAKHIDVELFSQIYEHSLAIKLQKRPQTIGQMVNHIQSFENLRDFLTSSTIAILSDLPFTILFLLVIAFIGGPIVFIPLLAIPCVFLASYILLRPIKHYISQSCQYQTAKHATLIETMNGIETIKSWSAEGHMQAKTEHYVKKSAEINAKVLRYNNILMNLSMLLQLSTSIFVVIVGVYLIAANSLSMGALIACTILTGRCLAPMHKIVSLLNRYHQARNAYDNIESIMQTPVERDTEKTFLKREKLTGQVKLNNIRLQYESNSQATLDDIKLSIKAGERIGIVGRNGSGKSSLLKILSGLIQSDSGTVLLDNTPIQHLDPAALRQHIAYMPQDITLFQGTIYENITMGLHHYDDEDLIKACHISGINQYIEQDSLGLDRPVGEKGCLLSVGQRQAIALTRCILSQSQLILLDEPTSNMDDFSENLFIQRLRAHLDQQTLVLVTHRGRLLQLVDRIIVVDGGKIVFDGPKEEALQRQQKPQVVTINGATS